MDPDLGFQTRVNLQKTAHRYLKLLDRIDFRRQHQRSPGWRDVLPNAVFRYENFWLPLLQDSRDSADLTPPWDIYYVWCLHILTSSQYRLYCRQKYGRVFNHQFHEDGPEEKRCIEEAKKIWESKFPDQTFDINLETQEDIGHPSSQILEVIRKSEEKHHTFYYQVSLPHYGNELFLDEAEHRYSNMLLLKRKHPSSDLCPTFNTELIRQAHVLHPCEYESDLKAFFGEMLDFDTFDHSCDLVTSYDHENRSVLDKTRRLWNASFGATYDTPGTKHRGNRHVCENLGEPSQVHLKHIGPESIGIVLDDILIGDVWSNDRKLSVEFRRLGQTSNSYQSLFRISAKLGEKISTKSQSNNGRIDFHLKNNRGIELHIFGKAGRCCTKVETHVANVFLDPRTLYSEDEPIKSKEIDHEMPRISYGDPSVTFKCKITVDNVAKPYVFSLDRQEFAKSPIPAELKPFIQLDSWTDLNLFHMDTFSAAKHSVPLIGGGLTYGCHVASCRDFDLGAVLLYEGTNLLSVAHTIGDDQLPNPDQVSKDHPLSLEKINEHAMLIRNKGGDWGICIMKPIGHDAEDSSVKIVFGHLQEGYTMETTFSFEDSTVLRLDKMIIDLYTGRVTLNSECLEVAEYVTLAYAIGVLYVFTTGRQMPTIKEHSTLPNGESMATTGHRSTAAKIRAKSSKKRYDFGAANLDRSSYSVTLSNLKSRRKKRSLFCTMLLACGLKSNMMVDEDLTTMSFHSEVSLLPKSDEEETTATRGMDDVHRHSFFQTLHETSRELKESKDLIQNSEGLFTPTTGMDNLAFEPVEVSTAKRRVSKTRKISEMSLIPRGNRSSSRSLFEEEYAMPEFLSEGFLEERAQKIVEGVMEGAIDTFHENENVGTSDASRGGFILKGDVDNELISNGHAPAFISEGDEKAPRSIVSNKWENFDEISLDVTRL